MALDDFTIGMPGVSGARIREFKHKAVAGAGDTDIITAVVGSRIWIFGYILSLDGADTVTLKSLANELGRYSLAAAGGFPPAIGDLNSPVLVCNVGEKFCMTVAGAGGASIYVIYKIHP